jgi:hypothetical protein
MGEPTKAEFFGYLDDRGISCANAVHEQSPKRTVRFRRELLELSLLEPLRHRLRPAPRITDSALSPHPPEPST